jgi:hypothetical protein
MGAAATEQDRKDVTAILSSGGRCIEVIRPSPNHHFHHHAHAHAHAHAAVRKRMRIATPAASKM